MQSLIFYLHNNGNFVNVGKLIGGNIIAVQLFAVEKDLLNAGFNVRGIVNGNIQLPAAEILVNLKSVPRGGNRR